MNWLQIILEIVFPLASVIGLWYSAALTRRNGREQAASQYASTLATDNDSLRNRLSTLESQVAQLQQSSALTLAEMGRLRVFAADIYTRLVSLAAWVRIHVPSAEGDPTAAALLDIPPAPSWLAPNDEPPLIATIRPQPPQPRPHRSNKRH